MANSSKPAAHASRVIPRTFCALRYDDAVTEADQSGGTVWKCIEYRCESMAVGAHAHSKRAYLVYRRESR